MLGRHNFEPSFSQLQRVAARRTIGLTALMLLLWGASPYATAQNFRSPLNKMDNGAVRALAPGVAQALRDPDSFQTGKAKIDDFFLKYYFPLMTQSDPLSLRNLGKNRQKLFKNFLYKAKVQAAQEYITGLSLRAGRAIARDNFHPAVRYNAALIIGLLDQRYAGIGANALPPVPLPDATAELLELVEQDEVPVRDATVPIPPSVKAAAWIGLERHARFGMQAEYMDRATQAALAVIGVAEPQEEVSSDVHHWMKCMAARMLAAQSATGPTAEIQQALAGLIADNEMGLEDRCCAAELLKKIDYKGAADLDGSATVLALGQLAQDVLEEEAKESDEFEKEAIKRAPSIRPRGFGRRSDGPDTPQYPRRRLLNRLTCITQGADSLVDGLAEKAKQELQTLSETLKPMITVVVDKDSGDLTVTGSVKKLKIEIDRLVDSWKPPAAEVDEDTESGATG